MIYKTTNRSNGRYYIGQHQTENKEDSYLGSGLVLKEAIAKYGRENFTREILRECGCKEEMNRVEAEVLCKHMDDPLCYNLSPGGQGGFLGVDAIKKASLSWTPERRLDYSKRMAGNEKLKVTRKLKAGTKRTDEEKQKISQALTGKKQPAETIEKRRQKHIGRKNTDETKRKMSEAKKGKVFTAEHRAKLSEAAKNRKRKA